MSTHWFALALLAICCGTAAQALEVSAAKPATVVLADGATVAEQTAARETADYLAKVTGAKVGMVGEGKMPRANRIFVGPTAAAGRLGIDATALGPEEWIVRTAGSDLYLVGGRPRGTLYAAYHFLEDVVGVHWWNAFDETVPSKRVFKIGVFDLRGKPAFAYRDIYMLYGRDGGRFAARNRLNRDGDMAVDAKYGGTLAYGPPYHVHTAFMYFPPQQHFAARPEWYSLIDGKRSAENTQLCWTNPELRKAFLARLLGYIETSWAEAKAANLPPPLVFDISQNDWNNPCQCDACRAIVKAEGSESGPIIDFVNAMADGVRTKYPEVFIDTLAYAYAQKAPKTLKARDNVIIRLCDTEADMIKPVTAPENAAFRAHIESWAAVARNLRVWDYAITYGTPGMPLPTAHTYGPDFRYYLAHHVEGVFTELEDEILADMRDFKIWMMMKTLEDPAADYEKLTDTFMSGHYGRGGKWVKQYLRALEAEAVLRKSRSTCWQGSPTQLTYLNADFVVRAQRLFDQAEKAVQGDPVLTRRVRYARLPLDRATIMAYPKLAAEWAARPGAKGALPLDREAAAKRALETWKAVIDQRMPEADREVLRQSAEGEIRRYAMLASGLPLPAKFASYPKGTVYDYTATMTRNWGGVVKVVKDPEAESGITNRLDLTEPGAEHAERYTLPMPWGLYNTTDKSGDSGQPIKAEDVPGPGYHWYKMGTFRTAPGKYLYFFWSWIIQLDIDNAWDPAKPEQPFEFWARIKFEGPRFPHAKPGGKDAICVERVVLVKAQ